MSSNQPVLPHVIIALNASDLDIDELQWDPDIATASVLGSLSRTVFKNAVFKKYAQFWRERQRQIETVQQLIQSYYTTIRVRLSAMVTNYLLTYLGGPYTYEGAPSFSSGSDQKPPRQHHRCLRDGERPEDRTSNAARRRGASIVPTMRI